MKQSFQSWCEDNNPELLKEWHPTKNGTLKPSEISCGSGKIVWWLGLCGHEWQHAVYLRVRSDKCPVCAGKLVIAGVNDLATTHPKLARQWDKAKNQLSPTQVSYHSNKAYWWICDNGHEWQAVMSRRAKGTGCPYCDNHKTKQGYNDLATTHPDLAKEWHPTKNVDLKLTETNAGSPKKAWWIGSCGHEWQAQVYLRTKEGFGCPYCSNRRVLAGFNDLESQYPELAKEWHPLKNHRKPSEYLPGSPDKVWWLCQFGHEWQASIISRKSGSGCPVCSQGRTTSFQEKAIAFYIGQLFEIEENYSPEGFKKKEIDIYIPSINVGIEYDGERYHKKQQRDLIKNKLSSDHGITLYRIREKGLPDIEGSLNYYVNPKNYKDLENAIKWLVNGISDRFDLELDVHPNLGRDEISILEKQYTFQVENSIKEFHPELIKDIHPSKNGLLRPELLPSMSNRVIWWQCEKGHEWRSSICNHVKGYGCPICSNKLVLTGYNDLATTNPNLAAEWHPTKNGELRPEDVTAGNRKYVWWQCKKGHEWKTRISTRQQGSNCPVCANQIVCPGQNDLVTTNPDLAAEWHPTKNRPLSPHDIVSGSHKKIWWQCEKGHEWAVAPYQRVRSNTKCPYCSGTRILAGYNDLATLRPDLAAEWHPYKNEGLLPTQVGIGNNYKVWWLGSCGHEWQSRIGDRCRGNGCPICSGKRKL